MADDLVFDTQFPTTSGECVQISPLVRRIVAENRGPFTFTGTCSYIVGQGRVAIIDPGPDTPEQTRALLDAVRGETVTHVLVSHTHRDHSPGARILKAKTGAVIVGCSPHREARPLATGEVNALEASADRDYAPDRQLLEGDTVEGPVSRAVGSSGDRYWDVLTWRLADGR